MDKDIIQKLPSLNYAHSYKREIRVYCNYRIGGGKHRYLHDGTNFTINYFEGIVKDCCERWNPPYEITININQYF